MNPYDAPTSIDAEPSRVACAPKLLHAYGFTFTAFALCFIVSSLTGLQLINPSRGAFQMLLVVVGSCTIGGISNLIGLIIGLLLARLSLVGCGGVLLHGIGLFANLAVVVFFLRLVYAPPTNLCGDALAKGRSLARPAACGALIVIAAGTAFGILHYIYLRFSTGDAIHLKEALALFVTDTVMGAGAGAAYGYLSTQSLPSWRRRFVICLVTMEAYLGLGTAIILLMYFLTPSLVVDLPAADPLFHVCLHAYGFILACLGTGIAYLVMCFRRAK